MNSHFLPMRTNTTLNNFALRRSALLAAITALFFIAALGNSANAQITNFWRDVASTDNWGNADVNNWYRSSDGWDVRRPDLPTDQWSATYTPKSYNVIVFNNNHRTTTVLNDVGGAKFYVAELRLAASSGRTFNSSGGGFMAMSNAFGVAKIESVSGGTGTYTFNVPILFEENTEINAVNGNLVFGSNSTITNNGFTLISYTVSGKQAEYNGVISGGGGLEHKGAGLVILNAANTYDGATTIETAGGVVQVKNTSALGSTAAGTTVSGGAALEIFGTVGTFNEALALNGDGVSGGGALRNVTGNNTWGGAVTLASGARINSDADTLVLNGSVDLANTNTLYIGGAGNITIGSGLSNAGKTTGDGALFKNGTGLLTLSANNSGLTGLVRLRSGTISITNGNSLGSGSLELGDGTNVATLLADSNATIANRIEIANNSSAGVINVASGTTTTVSGILSQTNGSADTTKFGKDGAGVLVFNNGGATYNGQIQIGNGTLVVGATGALGTNASTSARGIDLGLNVGDVSQSNNVALLASNGVTVGQSIFVSANTSGGQRTIGLSGPGTNTYSNEIFLGGNLTVNAGSSATDQVIISGAINNTGGLTKTGAGVLLLSGSNGYTGNTTISEGTLRLGADNRISSQSAVSISNGATLDMNDFSDTLGGISGAGLISLGSGTLTTSVGSEATFSGSISGSGALTKTGAAQLNLTGNNNFSGLTTISEGALEAQHANALGNTTGATTVSSGAQLKLFGGGSGISYAAETLTINGFGLAYSIPAEGDSGALRSVGGNNTWNGNITLGSNSRINSDSAGLPGSLTLAGNISGGANVLYVGSKASQLANMTISGTLSGAGALANTVTTSLYKSSGNTLTITGTQDYTGATRITAGTLVYNGTNLNTAVRVESGSTLAGSGSVGATTVFSGGTMSPGNSPGTQTYSSLIWEGGGNYNWQILDATGAAGTAYDTFVSTGAFTINATSGNKFNINLWSLSSTGPDVNGNAANFNSAASATWTLGTFGSITGFASDAFTINTAAANGAGGFANAFGGNFSISTNSTELLLVYTAPASSYVVDVSTGAVDQGAGAGITGGTNQFTGSASLTKVGAGTLVMTNGANDYTGATTIAEGAISIAVAAPNNAVGALGQATTPVAVGASTNDVAAGFDFAAAVDNGRSLNVIAGNGAGGTRSLSTSFGSGTATQSGAVALGTNTAITAASGSTLLVSGALTGTGGATVNGAGVVVLNNSNTAYSGTVTLQSGSTLRAGNNGALGTGGFTIDGGTFASDGATARTLGNNITMSGNATLGDATGTGDLTFNGTVGLGSSTRTLTVSNTTTLAASVSGDGGLSKSGNGTLVLSGNNSFTGNVDINAGRLNVSGLNAIGNSAAVTVSNGATFGLNELEEIGSLAGAGDVSLGGLLIAGNDNSTTAYSGVMSGGSGFVKKGSGVMTLSGANDYTGETYIVGGTLLFAATQGGSFTNTINIGEDNDSGLASTLAIGGSGLTFANNINVRPGDPDTATIDAQNTTGTTTLNGTLTLGKNAEIRAASGGGLALNGVISGTNNLTKTGSGTATLAASNTLTGNIDVDAGTLALSGNGNIVSAARVNVGSNSILDISGVSGAGSVVKIISEQGFNDGGSISLGGKTLTVNGGSTNTTNYFNTLGLSGDTGGLTFNAASSSYGLYLYGVSAYTGTTTVGSGTLTAAAAMSSGAFVLNGGTFATTAANLLSDTATMTFNGGALSLGGNETIGGVMVNSDTTLSVNSGINFTVGAMSGSGNLTKASSGTLTFSAAPSDYSGETRLNDGTILVGANNALGTGTVTINFDTGTGTRELAASSSTGYTLDNNFNLYFNAFTLGQTNGGTGSLTLGGTGKTFFLGNDGNLTRAITVNGNHTIAGQITGSNNVSVAGAGSLTLSGNNSFTGGVQVNGGSSVTLSGSNSFAGGVQVNNGTVLIGNNNALGTGTFQVQFDEPGAKTIASSSADGRTITNNVNIYNDLTIGQISGGIGSLDFSGVVQLGNEAGTRNLTAAAGTSHTFSGAIQGVRGITKLGDGTLTLSGATPNTYTGATVISAGTLNLNKTPGVAAIAGPVTVGSSATLLLSSSDQVADTAPITLSGGTIRRGSGVSETFFSLNLSSASTLDFGGGGTGSLNFGTYEENAAPSALLTINNFLPDTSFTFSNALFQADGSNLGSYFSFGTGYINSFITDNGSGSFTITAIPEPSTYLAAAGLLAMFLWPARRRLIKDTKSILGLRPSGRDRTETYRHS